MNSGKAIIKSIKLPQFCCCPTDPLVTKFGLGHILRMLATVPYIISISSGVYFYEWPKNFALSIGTRLRGVANTGLELYSSACDSVATHLKYSWIFNDYFIANFTAECDNERIF